MNAVAEPPHRWNAETATAEALGTLRPAGFGVVPKLVIVDATHHGTVISSKDGRARSLFQARFRLGRAHSQRGSETMKWLRLYHDIITDPRIRLVSVRTGLPVGDALAVWIWMLVNASQSPDRGALHKWDDRIAAANLDFDKEHVTFIREAMQGVLLDGVRIIDWDKRQVSSDSQRLPWGEWAAIREQIFKRDNYTCAYCGQQGGKLECDHVVPLSRGGTNDRANLITACYDCNRSKGVLLAHEWKDGGTMQ